MSESPLDKLAISYGNNKVIQSLVQSISSICLCLGDYGIAIGIFGYGLDVTLTQIFQKRAKIFFDEFAKGEIRLTPEIIKKRRFYTLLFHNI